jgi:pyridoxamine 5'-phosphate oxidase
MDPEELAALRRSYEQAGLDEADAEPDPFGQFTRWFADAVAAELLEPNAMVLATAAADGQPSSRTVLLKVVNADGFVFFTNYRSRKAGELETNPRASLLFPWYDLERQVSVVGTVERLAAAASAEYFRARPVGHQIGAWASRQSEVVASREVVQQRYLELVERFGDDVPVPDFWGGYRVVPHTVEFWQGRGNRLHDRLRYRRDRGARGDEGGVRGSAWLLERLSP